MSFMLAIVSLLFIAGLGIAIGLAMAGSPTAVASLLMLGVVFAAVLAVMLETVAVPEHPKPDRRE